MRDTMSSRGWRVAVLAAAAGLLLAACGSSKGSSTGATSTTNAPTATTSAPSGRTSLVIGSVLAPPTLDITTGSGAAIPAALLNNVYETLIKATGPDQYAPALAKSWTISDDGLTYTFALQTGVTFHNGEAFSSKDVKFSFDNAQANVAAGKAPAIVAQTFAPVASVAAPDANTIVITLKQRSRDFIYNLSQTGGVIVNEKALPDVATHPVGTGPFQFDSFVTNASLKLKRYDGYWGTKPALQTVEWRYISDPKAMSDSIKSPNGVDIIDNLTPDLFKGFAGDSNYMTQNIVTNGETILAINNLRAPLSDVRVRQAISYAIDKKAVNDIAESGFGKIIGSHASPNDPWFEDLSNTYAFDPAKAKDLLKQAGVSGLKLTIQVPPVPYATAAAPIIQQELGDVGISVDLKNIDFSLWIDQVFTKADYDLSIISHVEARDVGLYGNPKYYWRYDNPQVQDLLRQADAAPTADASNALYKQVLEQINKDAVNDWLFELPGLTVAKKGISGFPTAAFSLSYDVTGVK
ncbi:MAG: peptide/nickel transport system substrate-binding protein [Acidimicrobiaceae bacterium]|nr:peptide/nickel transport system substrate-binding protein [Acidimicrobiaceae bacterium]